MGASAAVVAAALIRKERELVEHFKQAGAVSSSSARSLTDLGVQERVAWPRLVRSGVIREGAPGTYYLEESAWVALGQRRRRVAFIAVISSVVVVAALLIVMWIVASR